jgi:Fe2+ transport system protein FeoA
MNNLKTIPQMVQGETGIIFRIQGGFGSVRQLENMGIRTGKQITKVSAQIWRGPQVIKIDSMQIALGAGIASKVLVETGR